MSDLYWIVSVEFWDHSHGHDVGACKTKVWGLLVGEDETTYHVYTWVTDGDLEDHDNSQIINILKSTVIRLKKIEQDRPDWLDVPVNDPN